ncbi:leucine-rich repeat receptor-like serine/threonine-protein kinase bam1 [Phtheirospermum japonicum]|uniref:Leucine-rich repeat receptor-like serine/threonine-protein kinase bam1 n=1 Tax=Phtheirospermum japonicum TaxID=374723 RepID=A0A830CVH0_9LAMI|nr:leucine-rich repeat receptor-like serine/threonine-protein kinase bam1 [Phtheirospermum japonicum]
MENQSLDRWIHRKKRKVLDWPARLRIAIGAAQGLCYTHHDCSPLIIHCDVKSNKILLDYDFKAKIADFGLAKILIKKGEPNTIYAVAGSFGYIAPGNKKDFLPKTNKQTKTHEVVYTYKFHVNWRISSYIKGIFVILTDNRISCI